MEAGKGRGQEPRPPVTGSPLPATVGSLGSSSTASRATGRLGPQCLSLVPGAAQEVGGEGQEATTAGGALGVGLCIGGNRALTLPPYFLGAQTSVCLAGAVSPCLQVDGLCVCVSLGVGLYTCGSLAVSVPALSLALSSLHICSPVGFGCLLTEAVSSLVSDSRIREPPCPWL